MAGGALFLAAVYVATSSTGGHMVNDVVSSDLEAWRIATTGHPYLDGLDLGTTTHHAARFLWTGDAGGHLVVYRSPGAIAIGLPAYFLYHLLGGDGFASWPGSWWAAVLAATSVVMVCASLSAHLSSRQRIAVGAVVGLTTPLWSVDANVLWPHALTVAGVAGMAWACSRERWWLLGLFGGLALWGRLHTVVILVVLGLGLAIWRRRPTIAVRAALPSIAFLGGASLWTHWMYRSWRPTGGYPTVGTYATNLGQQGLGDHLINEAGLLFSPDRGLLIWTPVLIVAVPAIVWRWSSLPDWTRLLALGGVTYTGVQGLLDVFGGGSGFYGYRLTLELLISVVPAAALSIGAIPTWAQRTVVVLCAAQFAAISLGAAFDGFVLNDDDGRAWRDNSVAYAVRMQPLTVVWLIVFMTLALLVAAVVRERGWLTPWPETTATTGAVSASRRIDEARPDRGDEPQRGDQPRA